MSQRWRSQSLILCLLLAVGCGKGATVAPEGDSGAAEQPSPEADSGAVAPGGIDEESLQAERDRWEKALRAVAIGMFNYESVFNRFPIDSQQPALSWRAVIAPYINDELGQLVDTKKSWDESPNKEIITDAVAKEVFLTDDEGRTRFVVLRGNSSLFSPEVMEDSTHGPKSNDVHDGTERTIAIVRVPEDKAVVWSEPGDIAFDPADPLAPFRPIPPEGVLVAFANGSTAWLPADIEAEIFAKYATAAGGEIVQHINTLLRERERKRAEAEFARLHPEEAKRLRLEAGMRRVLKHLENSEATTKYYPIDLPPSGDGAGLSWRVALLQYAFGEVGLPYQELRKKFELRQSWDSDANRPLLLDSAARDFFLTDAAGNTRFVQLTGNGAFFGTPTLDNARQGKGPSLRMMHDGTQRTILAVLAPADKAVPWSEPADVTFDPTDPLAPLKPIPKEGLLVGFASGDIAWLPADIDPELFKAYVTAQGGEKVDPPEPVPQPEKRQPSRR